MLVQRHLQSACDSILARVHVTREEDGEALSIARRVRLSQNLDDLGVREPLGDVTTGAKTSPQLGSGDVKGLRARGDLIHGLVFVGVGKIGHLLELDDLDSQFVLVLLHRMLGVIRAVELDSLGVLARTSMVASNDEMCSSVILPDDGVPDGFTRSTHAHGQRQQTQDSHSIGVTGEDGLVHTHTSEVVDISGLSETDDGVDQDIRLTGAGGANRQFTVSPVHRISTAVSLTILGSYYGNRKRIPSLEGDNPGPAELVEVSAQLCGSVYTIIVRILSFDRDLSPSEQDILTAKINIVIVIGLVHSFHLSTDIELMYLVVQVFNRRVLLITAEDQLRLSRPVQNKELRPR